MMELLQYGLLALGLGIWASAFVLHDRAERRKVERRLKKLGAWRRVAGQMSMWERKR